MNSNIIPQGPTETVTDPAAITREILLLEAETDVVISAVVYCFPATPPNSGHISAFTLGAGRHLFNVKTISFTGTATLIYRH